MRRSTTPYTTYARFNGTCAETGQAIKKGDKIVYEPGSRKVYANHSKRADEVRALEFAAAHNMADANW
jgi:hypothetical protein